MTMTRTIPWLAAAVWAGGAVAAASFDDDKSVGKHKCPALAAMCPVADEPIDPDESIDDPHGKIYFCCDKCITKYKADPAKYAGKVANQRIALNPKRVQVRCPVSGKPVDKSVSVEHHGAKIHFCCKGCVPKFEADPHKYMGDLAKWFTLQTKCPVSGHDIDPAVSVTTKSGDTVYFCCQKCVKPFEADPEKYLRKMHETASEGVEKGIDKAKDLMGGKK